MAALLALSGALLWGIGDFLGGLAARRLAVLAVLAISQAVGLAGVVLWVWLANDPFPGVSELLPAAAAGVASLIGLGALYRGLAVGAMGIVAPISAAAPVVPLAVDAARGVTPAALQWLGIALVLAGIMTLSREPSEGGGRRIAAGAGLAVVAALGFGSFIVGIDAGSDESAPWAVVAARSSAVTLALVFALLTSTSLRASRRHLPALVAVGAFDTGANVGVAFATTRGTPGIVAVLSSLYPIVTILLARIVLAERLSAGKRVGGAVALVGAVLVAAG
ncbi:MAG: DMT family transporter [Actinobacteria bacterium]|nr:DMT family transporter [Actinomycetota bacterium]